MNNITIQNSSSYGVYLQYVDNSVLDGVDIFNCLYGVYSDTCSATGIIGQGGFFDSNGTGMKMINGTANSIYFTTSNNSTTGHGLEMDNCTNMTVFDSAFDSNTGDGVNLKNCSGIAFISLEMIENGQSGIELVSGCSDLSFSGTPIQGNVGDGIKFTDTANNICVSAIGLTNNGGYGVNIANSNCNNNIFVSCNTSGNGSGGVNDLGTGTLKSAIVNIFS